MSSPPPPHTLLCHLVSLPARAPAPPSRSLRGGGRLDKESGWAARASHSGHRETGRYATWLGGWSWGRACRRGPPQPGPRPWAQVMPSRAAPVLACCGRSINAVGGPAERCLSLGLLPGPTTAAAAAAGVLQGEGLTRHREVLGVQALAGPARCPAGHRLRGACLSAGLPGLLRESAAASECPPPLLLCPLPPRVRGAGGCCSPRLFSQAVLGGPTGPDAAPRSVGPGLLVALPAKWRLETWSGCWSGSRGRLRPEEESSVRHPPGSGGLGCLGWGWPARGWGCPPTHTRPHSSLA